MASDRVVALVPAGGRGARMGSAVPKQFLPLGGLPLLVHSLRVLHACERVSEIIIAVPESDRGECAALLAKHGLGDGSGKVTRVVAGGTQRQDSVRHALEAADAEAELALVHDAVRPFITVNLVEQVLDRARAVGGAIVAIPMRDTVKAAGPDGLIQQTVDRAPLWLAQTPQAFRLSRLREVHAKAKAEGVHATDDAQLFERYGYPVALVEGTTDNIKVTRPEDLAMAEAILASRARGSVTG